MHIIDIKELALFQNDGITVVLYLCGFQSKLIIFLIVNWKKTFKGVALSLATDWLMKEIRGIWSPQMCSSHGLVLRRAR